jgi:hypothetical protein
MGDRTARMPSLTRRIRRGLVALSLVALLAIGALSAHVLLARTAPLTLVTLPESVPSLAGMTVVGPHPADAPLVVELLVAPPMAAMEQALAPLYDPASPQFRHWLPTGAFEARFGPSAAMLNRLDAFMRTAGAQRIAGPSAFLVRYQGRAGAIAAAFHTHLVDVRRPDGTLGLANTTPVQVPATLSNLITGVIGLDGVTQPHANLARPLPRARSNRATPSFGAAPGAYGGLTPLQIRSIYNANPIYYHYTNGAGHTLGVFEMSAWNPYDVATYERHFTLPNTPIQQILVDGGPGADHYSASQVETNIELQVALAPGVAHLYVYNAPDTVAGEVDEFAAIAHQNLVDALAISWSVCESDSSPAKRTAEEASLIQMASQGESAFAAAGDYGAFGCEVRYSGPGPYPNYTNYLEVDDPASDPFVTGVGGTSFFRTFDPGTNSSPSYPSGKEYVWNTLNNCSDRPFIYQGQDLGYCPFGAGGGGNSRVWGRPGWQDGPGVSSNYSEKGYWCRVPNDAPCREAPDVSIDADPNSGYGIYCTDAGDPICASSPGWNEVGGTGVGAALWATIAVLAVGIHHGRVGLLNEVLFRYDTTSGYHYDFHDIAYPVTFYYQNVRYTVSTNGEFPMRLDYNMATGLGTPDIGNFAFSWAIIS